MPEFFNVLPPDDARALLLQHVRSIQETELLPTFEGLGRVTAEEIRSAEALPSFPRSTMDGYAVRAADTFGAGDVLPAFLTVTGEVRMGTAADMSLKTGEAVIVHTGGMIPDTADAVVQIEHSQLVGTPNESRFPYEIEVFRAVAPGQNVIQVGEDIAAGATILPAGTCLRPQDIGGLLAVGVSDVMAIRRPRVAILATGDEVVSPASVLSPGQIRDINSYSIGGLCIGAGGIPVFGGIVPDDIESLREAAARALAGADMLVMSAGSSVSVRDMTVDVIAGLGRPGVLLHGVATRPGKPTIVGAIDGKPVLGLPGNPVSAMIQFNMFGIPAIYRLQGLQQDPFHRKISARLTQNIASESGREDYIPAHLDETAEGITATPIFGKSNLIYTLVHAEGLIKVPLNHSGLMAGDMVEVQLF